ncbi:MAG: IS1634 family transposase [Planctomycetota bacterium]
MKRREQQDSSKLTPHAGSRAQAAGQSLASYTIGALPILNRVIERARIDDFLQDYLPRDPRYKISPVHGILLLIRNYICSREPIYGVGEWASRMASDLLALTASDIPHLNDDRVGRSLDRLFESDFASIVLAVVVHVIKEFRVSLEELHNDSTTITFCGRYEGAGEQSVQRGRVVHAITWGHSKDHRPDLKQLLYNLTVSADGAVPVHFFTGNGNLTDDQTHRETWDLLRKLNGTPDFLYVADSKLATKENMSYIAGEQGRFLSVLPETRAECRDFRKLVTQQAVSWQKIWEKTDENGHITDVISIAGHPATTIEGYRLIWFHSTRKAELDTISRNDRLQRALRALAILRQKLQSPRTRYRQEARVRDAVEKRLAPLGATEWIPVEIKQYEDERYRQDHRGRPGKRTRYRRDVRTRFDIEYKIDPLKVAEDALQDGNFPLVTNDKQLPELEILRAYKRQPFLEKRFEQLKTDFEVAPVYLKTRRRIEALMCVYFFALLVQALVERELRRAMDKDGIEDLPLYPEGRPCRAPTTRRIVDVFENIQRHELTKSDGSSATFVTELSPLQTRVLKLLGISPSMYGK